MLLYGEIGVLGRQLTAFREDLHQTAGKEVELVAVVDETEQVAVASRIGCYARLLQDLVVGPANPWAAFSCRRSARVLTWLNFSWASL